MYPNNLIDKYSVDIFQECLKHVVGHLPLGNSGKFANTVFYFLKVDQENSCRTIVHGKAVNQKDDLDHTFCQIYLIDSVKDFSFILLPNGKSVLWNIFVCFSVLKFQ